MRRFFSPDSMPFWIMAACLILGFTFPTLGLYLAGVWTLLLVCALVYTWLVNHKNLSLSLVETGLMVAGLVLAGTSGVSTIRWWLPWLGDLLRVQS